MIPVIVGYSSIRAGNREDAARADLVLVAVNGSKLPAP